jgi:hypothetical protein
MAYSNNARIEVLRESALLETRLKPITAELNAYPFRVNKTTYERNLESAGETAYFHIDCCTGSDSFWIFEEFANCRQEQICSSILIQRRIGSQKLGGLKCFPMHEAGNHDYLEVSPLGANRL